MNHVIMSLGGGFFSTINHGPLLQTMLSCLEVAGSSAL